MSVGPLEVMILAVLYLVPLLICAWLAPKKRRGPTWLWLVLALVFSWIAVLVLAALSPAPSAGELH